MIYLTFADQPTGVFSSQVVDVCKYLDNTFPVHIKLISFISIRNFKLNKEKIKKEYPQAIVLPMTPRLSSWKLNLITLFLTVLFSGEKIVIARGVLAANLALKLRKWKTIKKVCYDGRGAIAAEWNEYDVVTHEHLKNEIYELEKNAVLASDYRISVSSKLVDYWCEKFKYTGNEHIVIPCTLNSGFKTEIIPANQQVESRKNLGYQNDDLVLVYSGSASGWQSFKMVEDFLIPFLNKSKKNKILFLSGEDKNIQSLQNLFPQQVERKWMQHKDVPPTLAACDYGVMIRENTITNRVASPTKFAEYLSAGLPVIISENIGDYSDFVRTNNCGITVTENFPETLAPVSAEEKKKMVEIVKQNFTKEAQRKNYKTLIEKITLSIN